MKIKFICFEHTQHIYLHCETKRNRHFLFFSYQSIFSFTCTDDSQDSRGREQTIFIPLHHFHPLTNIQTFICSFSCEMATTYFKPLPDCYSIPPYWITIWLIDDGMLFYVCLLEDQILGFYYSNLARETTMHGASKFRII